ncbi:hypothetical protein A3Q56_02156 [Intoshia linei]|uniref:C2H2-type domain-containing protein n=1 Tax=Intoshia linei TaxID=1819745 RepID=A0A177B767_9BILA|nr:hypothetical protein A3Q56_02156 [Intoshia linei]
MNNEYICEICGVPIKTKYGLQRHKKTHIKLKQFICSICGIHISRSDNLKRHQNRRHPNLSAAQKISLLNTDTQKQALTNATPINADIIDSTNRNIKKATFPPIISINNFSSKNITISSKPKPILNEINKIGNVKMESHAEYRFIPSMSTNLKPPTTLSPQDMDLTFDLMSNINDQLKCKNNKSQIIACLIKSFLKDSSIKQLKISKILTLSQKLILLDESNYFILFNIDKLYITFNKEYEWKPVMEEIDFILIIHGCISPVEPINHENDHLLIAYEKNIDIYHIKDFNLKQSFVMNNFLTKDCLISVDKVYQNLLVVYRNRPILLFFKRNLINSTIYESVRLVYFPCLYGFIDISLNESFDEDCNQTGDYINVCGLSNRNLESAMIHLTSVDELEGTIDSVISIKNASIDNMTKKSKIVPKILNENGAKETIQTINQNVIQEQCLIAINSAISKLSTKIVKPEEFNDNLTKNICDQIRHPVLQCMEIYFKPMHHSIMESLSNMTKYVSDAGSTKNADLDRRIQNVIKYNFIFKKEVLKRFDDVNEKINLLNQKFDIFMKRINDANDSKLLVEENFVENGQVVSEEIKIFEAVDSGDLPQAFELALMSNSLDLLTRLCNRVSVDDLFNENGTIILEQRIIISLIQQLTFNLNDDLTMKKSYLKNCLISIDCDDKVVKDCIQPVIEKCLTRISLNTKTKPDSELKVLHTMFMGISKFVQ